MARFYYEFRENFEQFDSKTEKISNRMMRDYNKYMEERNKCIETMKTLTRQYNETNEQIMEEVKRKIKVYEKRLEKIIQETEKIKRIQLALEQKIPVIYQQHRLIHEHLLQQLQNDDQQQGLSPRSIRRFHLFTADETLVGQQCTICSDDITVGRRMRRLTCDGNQAFCPACCETWFVNNNTCPLCQHTFV